MLGEKHCWIDSFNYLLVNYYMYLIAGARFVPDHTPDIDKKTFVDKYPNCPLMIFWHLYSKDSGGSSAAGNDPIISVAERNRHWKRSQKDRRVK